MRYAKLKVNGKTVQAHRYIYAQAHGPIPPGHLVHHIDGDRLNNAIENLQAMTPVEHSRHHNDRHPRIKLCEVCGDEYEPEPTKRKRSKTCSPECRRELLRRIQIARSGVRKIDPAQALELRRRRAAGERGVDLARAFGVSPQTVSRLTSIPKDPNR